MPKNERFTVRGVRKLTRDVYEMRLSGDTSAITAPGQFVNILVEPHFLRRPISVCDWDDGALTIVFRVVGAGTAKLAEAKTGAHFELLTGLGNGYDPEASKKPLLVGGGVGVPPLYGLCRRFVERGARPRVFLGFREEADAFYTREFVELGCAPELAFGREFVTDRIAREEPEYDAYFACGPEPMLRAAWRSLRAPGQLSFEARMGCGFGACVGCTCRTIAGDRRICRDGPVMRADELIWNEEEQA